MTWRITKFENVSFGLFNSCRLDQAKDFKTVTMDHCRDVETGRESGEKLVMFGQVVATLQKGFRGNDYTQSTPWYCAVQSDPAMPTIHIHSFNVCPQLQGIGIDSLLMRSYIELMKKSRVAHRISLVCRAVCNYPL